MIPDQPQPYARLFAPPRPEDFDALPDPFGRLDAGPARRAERRPPDDDPGWDAARADWMGGAPLTGIVGGDPFALFGSVGRDRANRRADVFKLQALLHREGHLDAEATEGPTGYWGNRDDAALRAFQKEHGLAVDGYADPGGETIGRLERFYRPQHDPHVQTMERRSDQPPAFPQTMEKRGRDTPLVPIPLDASEDRTPQPRQYAQAQEVENDAVPDRQGPARPTLNLESDRRRSILENTPARFDIAGNPKEDGAAPVWRSHRSGKEAVAKHRDLIERESERLGVDPDMVRAIMYFENADGHWIGLNDARDALGTSKSLMPMNIRPDLWGPLGLETRAMARDPEQNIRASVTLLRRIADRLDDPAPEKIGTLWNSLSQDIVSGRGSRIGRIFRERLWERDFGIGDLPGVP